jgi:hypothetical protein
MKSVFAAVMLWVVALSIVAGAGGEAASSGAPRLLSETGLYIRKDGVLVVDTRNRSFSPQYPLWSDGAGKARWVRLPPGAAIDARDMDRWNFPVGTRFWKEFQFGGRKVETRMLWKSDPVSWMFASYVWNEAQTDAELAPAEGLPHVAEVAPGKWHSIPSIEDCRACHDSARTEILGFSALQLSTDRDPLAPHAEPLAPDMMTLKTLTDENMLTPARPELLTTPPRIEAPDAPTRAVLGYLSTNCGACHNTESSLAPIGLHLKARVAPSHPAPTVAPSHPAPTVAPSHPAPTVAPSHRRTVAPAPSHLRTVEPSHLFRATAKWQIPNAAEGASAYVTPGAPDLSAILVRMRSRRPSSQMPPLGTVLPDHEGISLVSDWIASLK